MTFEEQAAELRNLEAAAKALGMTEGAFERILREVTAAGHRAGSTAEQILDVLRGRIYAVGNMRDRRSDR